MSMEMNKALDLLHGLVREVERKTCCHEETHRGGAIWEICDSCGAKWADDEGGKPEFAWPESVEKARAFLATHPAVEQAGGDERVIGWRERILAAHPNSDPGFWTDALLVDHMAAEIADLRAALAQPSQAQAEKAEAERPEGPTEDELEAAGLGYPLHKEEAVKLWYSGIRSEVITVLEAWEAIGHDTGINPDKEELLDSLRYMLEKCEAHDAALARVADLERQEPVALANRGLHAFWVKWTEAAAGLYGPGIKLYAAPVAQAQHSVPEGWMLVECGIWTQEQVDEMQKTVTRFRNSEFVDDRALAMAVADAGQCKAPEISLAELIAAAPGNSVPQAWLDVQAERRRQIEAKGWTPEHDDLYCSAELPRAAAAYILNGANDEAPAIWPFVAKWWKPRDARSNYVRASALILAEIERLDRAAPGKEVGHE